MEYILRKSVAADIPCIESLFLQMLRSIYHTNDVEGYEKGYLDKFYGLNEDWICVAESDGHVVGYLSIEVHREADGAFLYLDDTCVDHAYRGCGIGSAMLREAERFADYTGIHRIVLHVEKENIGAFRLYQRLGYTVIAEEGSRFRMLQTR